MKLVLKGINIINERGQVVAQVTAPGVGELFTAAPELLEAARALVAEYEAAPITPDCLILKAMDSLQDAIAKAEGK